MLNILAAIYVAVAATMISSDADSIQQYAAAKQQTDVTVTQLDESYDDLWMN
jgi:hypothetical protein